jgi:hypothetical protein
MDTRTRTEFRYIDIDWGDDQLGHPVWRLKVDGKLVATAPVSDWRQPPFALTEGRRFVPQYHSATSGMSGEPDSWVCRAEPSQPSAVPFWLAVGGAAACTIASVAWTPALIVAIACIFVAARFAVGAVRWE